MVQGLKGPFDNSLPTSDFDPWGSSKIYNIKTLCKIEMINQLFYQKITLFMILLQFQTILLQNKPVCYREENINRQVEKPYALTILSAVPTKITP